METLAATTHSSSSAACAHASASRPLPKRSTWSLCDSSGRPGAAAARDTRGRGGGVNGRGPPPGASGAAEGIGALADSAGLPGEAKLQSEPHMRRRRNHAASPQIASSRALPGHTASEPHGLGI